MPRAFREVLTASIAKIDANMHLAGFPDVSDHRQWHLSDDGGWTGGFWIGLLWAARAWHGDQAYEDRARELMAVIAPRATERPNHDLGMLFCPSFVTAWTLTRDPAARDVAHQAARTLAAQYNTAARLIPGWGYFGHTTWEGSALVDTLMNVPLLAWAERLFDDRACGEVARAHVTTSLALHVRADGSTNHVARFDPTSGLPIGADTYQGLSPESCWARGQAWAITGLTVLAELWGDTALASIASKVADWYLAYLPSDLVPYWDFQASGPEQPKDSSAAAIAAYGLLRLGTLRGDPTYTRAARATMDALCTDYVGGPEAPGILVHATADLPHGIGIDGCTIYGDYFFVRSLQLLIEDAKASRPPVGVEPS